MIAIEPGARVQLDPDAGAERVRRRSVGRARWMTLAAALLGLLLIAAGAAPIGLFLPLVALFGFLLPFWGLPWVFGFVYAWAAWRRREPGGAGRAFAWLAPAILLAAALAVALGPWPSRLAAALAEEDMDALRAEAAGVPARQVQLDDRWLGPWPVERVVRYASGELRMELLGGRIGERLRGLAYDPDGPPLPGSWQPVRWRELGGGWHAWER